MPVAWETVVAFEARDQRPTDALSKLQALACDPPPKVERIRLLNTRAPRATRL